MMESFDRELKKAAEKYTKEEFSADIPSEYSDEANEKIKKLLQEGNMKTTQKRMMKRSVKTVLICAAVLGLSVLVCAAAPAVREYLNMVFLREDSIERLTEVPDGYIGIYDVQDLDNVRNDLHANYILMNDIVITEEDYAEGGIFENGFEPIGDEENAFTGIFNGNGYVIDGLKITAVDNDNVAYEPDYVGLFGNCERFYPMQVEEDGKIYNRTGKGYGIIKNLGLINGTIDVQTENGVGNELHVGSIAGQVDYLVGCFAENMEINVTNAMNSSIVYVGGIAGYSNSCVTSYFDGQIVSGDYESHGITTLPQYNVPWIMTRTVMDELVARLDEFNGKKMMSFYVLSETYFNEALTRQTYDT